MHINELKENNQKIELNGFVDKIRNLQYVQFVILRDITGKDHQKMLTPLLNIPHLLVTGTQA